MVSAASTAPTVSLFGLRCPFLRPGPRIAPANARRASQDRALARPRGLGLYGTEHDGRLEEPGSIVLADICVNASCAVMAVAAPRSTSVTELSSHSTYGRFQIIGLREGQSPAWAETRPSRGSGAPPFAVTYGPTPRSSRGGTAQTVRGKRQHCQQVQIRHWHPITSEAMITAVRDLLLCSRRSKHRCFG